MHRLTLTTGPIGAGEATDSFLAFLFYSVFASGVLESTILRRGGFKTVCYYFEPDLLPPWGGARYFPIMIASILVDYFAPGG